MRVLSVLLVALLCCSGLAAAQEGLSTKAEAVAKVFQVTPEGAISLLASRWMQFSNCAGEAECCAILAGKSLTYKNGPPPFTATDLALAVQIDEAYRTKGSILITWTLRIEGQDGEVINPWKTLCGAWHGSVTETFKGGQIYSQAYVSTTGSGSDFVAKGQPASMTIPDGGSKEVININDPTHSGSYLLKPSDFGGKFPAKVWISIYWKNDTSMIVTSSDKYRSLIATLLPTSE
ncbi:MAG: hypothetical protein V1830_02635 [Candidatus Omnitrophota bacterium]